MEIPSCAEAFIVSQPIREISSYSNSRHNEATALHSDVTSSSPLTSSSSEEIDHPNPITITTPSNNNDNEDPLLGKDIQELKSLLVELLSTMTEGSPQEFELVERYVNAIEQKFEPPQTLDFLNMIMGGNDWQFLFTTNQLGRPSPKLRLTGLVQNVRTNGFDGEVENQASWSLAEDGLTYDCQGTFGAKTTYTINQGARMTINDDLDLTIRLSKGSNVPTDTQDLIGLIHRAMPTEMFDNSDLAMDTTFLDTDIKIVRFTGKRHEGVRNIFIRNSSDMKLNPNL